MAPEQFNGTRVDEACDVFALGCILFEAVTGRVPWSELLDHPSPPPRNSPPLPPPHAPRASPTRAQQLRDSPPPPPPFVQQHQERERQEPSAAAAAAAAAGPVHRVAELLHGPSCPTPKFLLATADSTSTSQRDGEPSLQWPVAAVAEGGRATPGLWEAVGGGRREGEPREASRAGAVVASPPSSILEPPLPGASGDTRSSATLAVAAACAPDVSGGPLEGGAASGRSPGGAGPGAASGYLRSSLGALGGVPGSSSCGQGSAAALAPGGGGGGGGMGALFKVRPVNAATCHCDRSVKAWCADGCGCAVIDRTRAQIILAVAIHGLRPTLPVGADVPPGLRLLMQACWREDPKARPSVLEVRER